MTRRIVYITGTRADFGLMHRTLAAIDADPMLSLSILATGMHLSARHGHTFSEVEASGLRVAGCVPVSLEPPTGATMVRGIATMVAGFTDILEREQPDLVLLLGDRGEMLAGAIAALHLGMAVAHVHGGERSGTVDEPVRHAVSKMSHLHLAATREARDRLIRMGEDPSHIYVTGAPGIDGLADGSRQTREVVAARHGLDPNSPLALMVYHPVLQEAAAAGEEAGLVLDAVLDTGAQAIVLMPNADAGSDKVREALEARRGRRGVTLVTHLRRDDFLDAMARADVMVGNSSAGIIEAASFGTRVVNVGTRQNLRERNANIVDVPADSSDIGRAVAQALEAGRIAPANIYGDGTAAGRIVAVLRDAVLDAGLMAKINGY